MTRSGQRAAAAIACVTALYEPKIAYRSTPAAPDDRLEVAEHRVERQVGDVPLRAAGPACVELDQADAGREPFERPAEDRDRPFGGVLLNGAAGR